MYGSESASLTVMCAYVLQCDSHIEHETDALDDEVLSEVIQLNSINRVPKPKVTSLSLVTASFFGLSKSQLKAKSQQQIFPL